MAEEQGDPEEAGKRLSSSSPAKRIEEPGSPPGGRSSAAERRVGAPRIYTPEERAVLLEALRKSGQGVEDFAAEHGLHVSTLYMWRYRARHGLDRPGARRTVRT